MLVFAFRRSSGGCPVTCDQHGITDAPRFHCHTCDKLAALLGANTTVLGRNFRRRPRWYDSDFALMRYRTGRVEGSTSEKAEQRISLASMRDRIGTGTSPDYLHKRPSSRFQCGIARGFVLSSPHSLEGYDRRKHSDSISLLYPKLPLLL
jgi:hypothetical protein